MPIYEYRCGQCGHEFETIQKISEAPLEVCPACSESALVKKVSAAGFRLKGGGWYETDFKSGNQRNVSGSGESAENKESKGEPKADPKPKPSSASSSESSSKSSEAS